MIHITAVVNRITAHADEHLFESCGIVQRVKERRGTVTDYNPDEWVTITHAASMLTVPLQYLQKLVKEGRLTTETIDGRIQVRLDEVNEMMETLAK